MMDHFEFGRLSLPLELAMATATATTSAIPRVRSQRFRAPPPSPIATGKGRRSAAVDDRVLSEYLDGSLRVPDLSLPQSFFPMKPVIKVPPEIDLCSMVSGNDSAARCVLSAAAEIGAMRVVGGGKALVEEVRASIEVGKGIMKPEGERSNLDIEKRWFARRDGTVQEFVWYRLRSPETERLLRRTWPESYPALRYVPIKETFASPLISKCYLFLPFCDYQHRNVD